MIAREGLWFILIGFTSTGLFLFLAVRFSNLFMLTLAAIICLLSLFTTYFFRDPDRNVVSSDSVILSPADGRVVQLQAVENHPHVKGKAIRISIFLSALDVHINRIPISGVINYVRYTPGKYLLAWKEKASLDNERTEIGMTTPSGEKIEFRQIAGTVARRIVCNLEDGKTVQGGDKFGLIRFGSRMDVIVQAGAQIQVRVGDKVKGGLSELATFGNDTKNLTKLTGEENFGD